MSLWAVLNFLSVTMKKLKIKTHQMKNVYEGNHFFILSKGLNAGKPMEKPYPNCFVLFAKSEEEKNKLYWLCYSLWQGNFFRPFLTGSVIPFIRLGDLKTVIKNGYDKLELMIENLTSLLKPLRNFACTKLVPSNNCS